MAALEDNVNVGRITLISVVGIAVTYFIVVALQIMYFRMKDNLEAERGTGSNLRAGQEQSAAQLEELGSYGWVDRENGVVRLPIDEAIRIRTDETGDAAV